MACYGPLLTPRAAVSQRSLENYEIVDQCDSPSTYLVRRKRTVSARAWSLKSVYLACPSSVFFRLVRFPPSQCSQDLRKAFLPRTRSIDLTAPQPFEAAAAAYYRRIPQATELQGSFSTAR